MHIFKPQNNKTYNEASTEENVELFYGNLPDYFIVMKTFEKTMLKLFYNTFIFFSYGSRAPRGARLPHFLRFRDHTLLDTPHSVELLWTSDQPVAETST